MNRLMIIGILALSILVGCPGPTQEQQMDQAKSYFETGKTDQARVLFSQLADRNPSDKESRYFLGRINHAENQLEWAIYWYQCALSVDPSYTLARQWLDRATKEAGTTGQNLIFLPKPIEHKPTTMP